MKKDDLSPAHLGWLVESRAANQRAALKLFALLDGHHIKIKRNRELLKKAQPMVAVCFSLWRAAFLADKTGKRRAVLDDAMSFLGKMLTDNAINYSQDRSAREWTFNYYMNNAKDNLLELSQNWRAVSIVLSKHKKVIRGDGTTSSSRRWDRHQKAFETALGCFANDLEEIVA